MITTLKRIGYVVDFCPICRGLRTFAVKILSENRKTKGYIKQCSECEITSECDYKMYNHVEKKLPNNVESLVKLTFPHIREHYHERLLTERNLEENPKKISSKERMNLLHEPFTIFMPILRKRLSNDYHISNTVISLGTTVIILFISFIVLALCSIPNLYLLGVGVLFLLTFGLTIYELNTNNQRYLTEKVFPVLGKTLATLKPTPKEIQVIFQNYRETQGDFVDKIPLDKLMNEILENTVTNTW